MGLAAIKSKIKTVSSDKLTGGLAGIKTQSRLEKQIGELEEDLSIDQKGSFFQRASNAVLGNPVVTNVLDIISRPNYAVAGAFEEIALGHGFLSATQRVGKEILSGIAGIQGEKQAFGEVFKDLGFGPGVSISNAPLVSLLFSDSGNGIRFQRGGFFDFTARGALGLTLDIFTDPTTYLTFGAGATAKRAAKAGEHFLSEAGIKSLKRSFARNVKRGLAQGDADRLARQFVANQIDNGAKHLADKGGIKLFGKTLVPGEVFSKPAKSVSDGVVKFLHKSSLGEGVISIGEGIGNIFNRDFKVRKIPAYIARKQLYLTTVKDRQRSLREMIEDLYRGTSKDERVQITNFIDSGGKSKLKSKLAPLVKKTTDIYSQFAEIEQSAGLLKDVALDYVFHTYDGPAKKVKEILGAKFDSEGLRATLRGSQKERTFNTLEQARKVLAAQGIKPIEDSAELLLRRGLRHIHATETNTFFKDVADRFGIRALDDKLEVGAASLSPELNAIGKAVDADVKALKTTAGKIPAQATTGITKKELAAVEAASRRGVPITEIRNLSTEGRREFLRRRFERVQNPIEMERVINKYREFENLFPETTNRATRQLNSHMGEGMATLDLPEFKGIAVPSDIAQDIVDFNKNFINKEDVQGLLRAYDKFNNGFKVGVTAIFLAFHFRNAYSNIVQLFTDIGIQALSPVMHSDAIRILAGDVNGSFLARHGRRWGYSEVAYEAKRRGVISDYRNIFETFGDKIPIRTGKNKAAQFLLHPVDSFKRFGGIIENEARLSAFTNYLRRGLDPETAAQRVNKVLFDYGNLSKIERDVLARVFPFYRWTRKNIALQAERLVRNPGQAALQAKLTRQNAADPTLLPKYLRGDFVFTLESEPKDGKFTILRGLDLPITDLNVLSEPLQFIAGNLSPAVKIIPELIADQDFFTQRKISENSTPLLKGIGKALDLLPQPVKTTIGFNKRKTADGTTEFRMNPTLAYIVIKSWALNRVYGTAARLARAKSIASSENMLDLTTGFRLQDVDVDVQAGRIENEYKKILEARAISKGIRRSFRITFKPKPKKNPAPK